MLKSAHPFHLPFPFLSSTPVWDENQEKWYFSIVDVVVILTDSPNPQVYWRVLKKRLLAEGNETVTNCNGLKLVAADGKKRMTDVADTEQLFRLIQSIPSPRQSLSSNGWQKLPVSG
jgi:hypothetical protein